MKKNLLILLCSVSLFTSVNAQQYHPMLDSVNSWKYISAVIPIEPRISQTTTCSYPSIEFYTGVLTVYTAGDTIIHSLTYKQVYSGQTFSSVCLYGFIREDTSLHKVYFQDVLDSPEVVLYDFNMHIGDSIKVKFFEQGYFEDGQYTLDSVGSVTVSAGVRRVFYLNCHACFFGGHTLIWVESVGNLGDAIYPYCANQNGAVFQSCPGFPHDFEQIMTCFSHNQKVYYDTCAYQQAVNNFCFDFQDTCDYWNICGGIKEVNSVLNVLLSPDPASTQLNIQIHNNKDNHSSIVISNVLGQTLYKSEITNPQSEINISALPAGIYFAEIVGDNGRWVGKFVKE